MMKRVLIPACIALTSSLLVTAVADESVSASSLRWVAKSPREEIRPAFTYEPTGGPNRTGSLAVSADQRNDFSLRDADTDTVQSPYVSVVRRDTRELKHRCPLPGTR